MMKIAAFDCAASLLAVGVSIAGSLAFELDEVGAQHGEQLLPRLQRLCEGLGLAPLASRNWDLIVCGQGPGSFSGVRIALASAKGLALAAGAPFVLVSSLAAWALVEPLAGTVFPVIDARRERVYTQAFVAGVAASPVWDIAPEQLRLRLQDYPQPWYAVGPDARLLAGEPRLELRAPLARGFMEQLIAQGCVCWRQQGAATVMAGPHYLRAAVPEGGVFASLPADNGR